MPKTLVIASDHAGFALKERLKRHLQEAGYALEDVGAYDEKPVDYPDMGKKAAEYVISGRADYAIILCGSGIGISIAANRFPDARAALCHNKEVAKLARQHNDANMLALGARVIDEKTAIECVDMFLNTAFEGGRHAERVKKLSNAADII